MSKGVLLVNLGSPNSPSVPDVRRYLREFLMDGRVLDVNWLARFCIVHFAILPTRPKQSAEAYEKVWTAAGSPLIATSRNVRNKLQEHVNIPIELAMRYQNPSIPDAVAKLAQKGVDELLLIPLFPHYAMSSFETAVERVREVAAQVAPRMRIEVQPPCLLKRERRADDARGVADDEPHLLGRAQRARDEQIALVFAVVVVGDDHDLAAREGGDCLLDVALRAVVHGGDPTPL